MELDYNIEEMVRNVYWDRDMNCANTILECLSAVFDVQIDDQLRKAVVGLHGAGGYRAQCGLVEGMLLFIGLYADLRGKESDEAVGLCYLFAQCFEENYGSLRCYDLRPGGFTPSDPPHACEALTVEAAKFGVGFIKENF